MKHTISLITLLFFTTLLNAQSVLIEEFTNINHNNATESSFLLDSLYHRSPNHYCIIRYHTDDPAGDPFNENVKESIINRMDALGEIDQTPMTVIDGDNRPNGVSYSGATTNTTHAYLDSIFISKEERIRFFGLALNFSDDFKSILGSSGMFTINNSGLKVRNYRALVEKVIDVENPIGPNGQTTFTNVFRGWITNGRYEDIPGNGSFHGWEKITIPPSVKDLNNLHMIAFVTDLDGKVLDCTSIDAGEAPSYSLKHTNLTESQSTVCDSIVVPRIRIKNTGVHTIEGVAIKTQIGDSVYIDFRYDDIKPAQEAVYVLDEREILLPRGTHFIDVSVDYILNSPTRGDISATNGPIRYLVGRAYNWENIDFESMSDDSFGPIIVRSKVNAALKIVSAEDVGGNEPIGAYGLSDHALMVDCWTWPWDDEDAGNVFLVDNKNFAYLYFDHFPINHIKQPVLKFDVASANKPNHKCIEVAGSPFTCTRNPIKLKTLTGNNILSTTPNTTSRYVPKAEDWRSHTVDLYRLKEGLQTHLRLKFTNHVDFTKPNAFYIDNIRIESNEKICLDDDVILKTQSEVDSFIIKYPDCNTIQGSLCIGFCDTDSLSNIQNLNGLKNINTIYGAIKIINNPSLVDVGGLSKLREVYGSTEIINNDNLGSLEDINTVTAYDITDYIIQDNETLEYGLSLNAPNILGSVIITNNPSLKRLPFTPIQIENDYIISNNPLLWGFSTDNPLEKIGGDLVIEGNQSWVSLRGFNNIKRLEGNLIIKNNNITSLYGLHQIDTIKGNIVLQNNHQVENIGFLRPNCVNGNIHIANNDRLINISSLENINYDSLGSRNLTSIDFELSDNDSLQICDNALVCKLVIDNNKDYIINGNGQNCRNKLQVLNSCNGISNDICYSGDQILHNQEAVDSFIIKYPFCNIIDGNLCIGCDDNLTSDITDLSAFVNIDTILGSLTIDHNNMVDLEGLKNLKYVKKGIIISNNQSLVECNLFTESSLNETGEITITKNLKLSNFLPIQINTIKGSVNISNNPELKEFPITANEIQGDLIIKGNQNLNNLTNDYPLSVLLGNLELSDLPQWTDLRGFININKINNSLIISKCGINTLLGLQNLKEIEGNMILSENYKLLNLNNLSKLVSVKGGISISDNSQLIHIQDIDDLNYDLIGTNSTLNTDFTLTNNGKLKHCNTPLVCKIISENEKSHHVENNGDGCKNTDELKISCMVNTEDNASNHTYLLSPNPFSNTLNLVLEKRTDIIISNAEGKNLYEANLPSGNHSIELNHLTPGMYFIKIGSDHFHKIIKTSSF